MSLNQRVVYDLKFGVSTSPQPLNASDAPANFRLLPANVSHPTTSSQRFVKNLNKRDFRGETHLHLCARRGDLAMCKKFVEEGADVNVADNAGWTPLHEACAYGFYEMVEFLIQNNADVNKASYDGVCPLHDAVQSQNPKLVWLLLKNGASPLTPSANGQLPIDLNKDGIQAINELLLASIIPDEYIEKDANCMDSSKYNEQDFASAKEEKPPASGTVVIESTKHSAASSLADGTVQSQTDSTSPMFPQDKKLILSEKVSSTSASAASNVVFSTLKKEKKDGVSSVSLMRKSNKLFTTASHSSGGSLIAEKGRKRGGSAASALSRKRGVAATSTAVIVPLVDAVVVASNSSSDVYEFRSSPESADGDFDAMMDGGVSGGSLLQKSASAVQYSSNSNSSGLVAYLSSAPAPTATESTSDLPTSSTDSVEVSASLSMDNDSFLSAVASDDVTSAVSGTQPTAPKRIKTATLAKELLAAAANLSADDGSDGGGDDVSVNTSAKSENVDGVDDRADFKLSHYDIVTTFNKDVISAEVTDDVNGEEVTRRADDLKEMNTVHIDGLQDVLLQNKKVPPLRILLPKASSAEDSGEHSPANISADQKAANDLSTTSAFTRTNNLQQPDGGAGSSRGEPSADDQSVVGDESSGDWKDTKVSSSTVVSGTARVSTRRHHHHHHRHHRTSAGAATAAAVTARNALKDRQSMCGDEEDANIASVVVTGSEPAEESGNAVANDPAALAINRQSQLRVTRSRVRQNGEGLDDSTNGGGGVKRKAGGAIVTRRSAAGRRAGSVRPVRGPAATNLDINLGAVTDGPADEQEVDADSVMADDSNSRDGGSGNVNEGEDEENVAENESINCDSGGFNSAEDDLAKAKEMAVKALFGRNCFDASVEFHNVIRDGWRREYIAQLEQLTSNSSSLAQSIDHFTLLYRRHLLKYHALRHTKQQCQALETELNFPLPATMERLRKEHAKRRAQLSEAHRRERERLMEFAAREYCRTVVASAKRSAQLKMSGATLGGGSTQQQQQQSPLGGASRVSMGGGSDALVMNAVRLLRDAELYDPFSVSRSVLAATDSSHQSREASVSPTKLSGGAAAKSASTASELSANSSAERTQLLQRLKHMSVTAKNRQVLEAHSLFVTQLAEWQKMVDKCYRQQQQRQQQQQKQKEDEVEEEEQTQDENGKNESGKESGGKSKKPNSNSGRSNEVVIIDESNRHLLNAVVRQIPVDEATFTFLSALTAQ